MPADTRTRILDAAERLFADRGFASTSLRAITAEAEVNLAAVHYHFGSKDALFRAVFARRIAPINKQRLELLDALEANDAEPDVQAVLHALVAPVLELRDHPEHAHFVQIVGRMMTGAGEHWGAVVPELEEIITRFGGTLRRLLPHLEPDELTWRLHFLMGAMSSLLTSSDRLAAFSCGLKDASDTDAMLAELLPFATAGMLTPGRLGSKHKPGSGRKEAS